MAKSKGKKRIVYLTLLVLAIGGGVIYSKYAKRVPPVSITEEKVARRNITEVVVANGKLIGLLLGSVKDVAVVLPGRVNVPVCTSTFGFGTNVWK